MAKPERRCNGKFHSWEWKLNLSIDGKYISLSRCRQCGQLKRGEAAYWRFQEPVPRVYSHYYNDMNGDERG